MSLEMKQWIVMILMIALVFAGAIVLNQCYFKIFRIENMSMEPTLHIGDKILVRKILAKGIRKRFDYGDLLVFTRPENEYRYIVKRVVGLPGDTVEIVNHEAFVNGIFISDTNNFFIDSLKSFRGKIKNITLIIANQNNPQNCERIDLISKRKLFIGNNAYFLMGDNQIVSEDSRSYGYINYDRIIGKVLFIMPSNNMVDSN